MTALPLIPSPQGSTRLFAIIGDPIVQVQAPMLINQRLAEAGIDAVMVALQIPAAQLDTAIAGLKAIANFDGMLVTVPHKFAMCTHADELSPTASLAGSANALRRNADGRWVAENFDGLGFVQGLRQAGHAPENKHVLLAGAGGAGVAIGAALAQAGIGSLMIMDPDAAKAAALAERLNAYRAGLASVVSAPSLAGVDLAINATPLGMRPDDPLSFPVDQLPAHAVVADIVMKPAQTRLLETAKALGYQTHAGLNMLAPQVEMYQTFFNLRAAK